MESNSYSLYVHEKIPFFLFLGPLNNRTKNCPVSIKRAVSPRNPGLVIITTIGDCLYSLIASLSQTQTREEQLGLCW